MRAFEDETGRRVDRDDNEGSDSRAAEEREAGDDRCRVWRVSPSMGRRWISKNQTESTRRSSIRPIENVRIESTRARASRLFEERRRGVTGLRPDDTTRQTRRGGQRHFRSLSRASCPKKSKIRWRRPIALRWRAQVISQSTLARTGLQTLRTNPPIRQVRTIDPHALIEKRRRRMTTNDEVNGCLLLPACGAQQQRRFS